MKINIINSPAVIPNEMRNLTMLIISGLKRNSKISRCARNDSKAERKPVAYLLFLLLFLLPSSLFPQVVLNEVMASNDATLADEDGDFPDWVELYATGTYALGPGRLSADG